MRFFLHLTAIVFSAICVSAAPGDLRWSFKTGGAVRSSPAAGTNGWIVFGSLDSQVYALDPQTAELKWKASTGGSVISSPTIGENGLVVIGTTGGLLALDGLAGTRKWLFKTTQVLSTPAGWRSRQCRCIASHVIRAIDVGQVRQYLSTASPFYHRPANWSAGRPVSRIRHIGRPLLTRKSIKKTTTSPGSRTYPG